MTETDKKKEVSNKENIQIIMRGGEGGWNNFD